MSLKPVKSDLLCCSVFTFQKIVRIFVKVALRFWVGRKIISFSRLSLRFLEQPGLLQPTFPLSCAARGEHPRSTFVLPAAHCMSIDYRTANYVLAISRADLLLELTRPSIPRTLSKLLEGTLATARKITGELNTYRPGVEILLIRQKIFGRFLIVVSRNFPRDYRCTKSCNVSGVHTARFTWSIPTSQREWQV